ncbi:formin-like protein [Triticum aestivum]|uniref:formin-like protein n=1 Tax=Triticum aestivum TaxID=4565 RepID=UPI001D007845|nr:formin-like protein [Triticum aestivum]
MEVTHSQFSSYVAWYKQYENSRHGSEAVPAMVKIPYRMMLDVLLETLGLPPAEYRTRVYDGSRVCVTILFHTPTSYVGNDRNRMAIPEVQFVDHSMSEDSAAMEAIGYIKCTVKTEIRDYNYSTMKKLEEENRSLKHELNIARYNKKKMKTKIRSIKNKLMIATYEKKQNAMGWFVLTSTHGIKGLYAIWRNGSTGAYPTRPNQAAEHPLLLSRSIRFDSSAPTQTGRPPPPPPISSPPTLPATSSPPALHHTTPPSPPPDSFSSLPFPSLPREREGCPRSTSAAARAAATTRRQRTTTPTATASSAFQPHGRPPRPTSMAVPKP